METFAMDKTFYDIATGVELWDSDMDPVSRQFIN